MSRLTRLRTAIDSLERHLASSWNQPPTLSPAASWEELLKAKKLIEWRDEDPEVRTSLVTDLLSYPVTLAAFLRETPCKVIDIVGARREATLSVIYWAQTLREVEQDSLTLRFTGPDIPEKLNLKEDSLTIGKQTLHRQFSSALYTTPETKPDAVVFFNPGFFHAKLRASWLPTVSQTFRSRVPALVTGLHFEDAHSDHDFLKKSFLGKDICPPRLNPFASANEYPDGTTGRIARANMYVWGFQG